MLTYEQVRISLLQFYYHKKPIYNIYFELNFEDNINFNLFERCINYLIINNIQLQSNVLIEDDKLKLIFNKRKFKIIFLEDVEEIKKEINNPFDLSNDLLFKFICNKNLNKFYCIFHDLIIDGETTIIFFKELEKCYNSLLKNKIPKFIGCKIDNHIDISKLEFWKEELDSNLCNNWMVKKNSEDFKEDRIQFEINNDIFLKLKLILEKLNVTLFDYMTSIIHLLIRNITEDKIIYTDTIFSGNQNKIGLFNKVVLLKNGLVSQDLDLNNYILGYSKYLLDVKNNIIPLELVVNKLYHSKNLKNLPNIRIHFEYFNKNMKNFIKLGNSTMKSDFIENSSDTIRQLLIFNVCECSDKIECYISFRSECFDLSYIQYLIDSLKKIINCNLDLNIKDIIYGNKNNYNTYFKEEINKRFEAYKMAGSYPNVKYSEFKKRLDYFV